MTGPELTTPIGRPIWSTWRRTSAAGSSSWTWRTIGPSTRATSCSASTQSRSSCAWTRCGQPSSDWKAKLSVTADQVASQTTNADTANRGILTAEAQLGLASSTLDRLEPLLPRGYVTAEQVDQARTAKRTAEVALQQARLQANGARQAISSTKPVAEELEAAKANLAIAERDLRLDRRSFALRRNDHRAGHRRR